MTAPLVDSFGRVHRDLRISLTDHCNLRCTYCMPAEEVPWLPRTTLLSPDELMRIVRVAVGITEVRLTGGEPLLRPDVVDVVAAVAGVEGPAGRPEVSITTNGIGLARLAGQLRDAGLSRVNVSLDTLRPDRFLTLTRRDRLAVLLRGINDDEAVDLVRWACGNGYELRFIEQMPLDAGHTWTREGMVTAADTMAALSAEFELTPLPGRGAAPAQRFAVGDLGVVGIIASVTLPFCGACDRLRLTADGQLRSCLFAAGESDLRGPLRSGASDEELAGIIRTCLAGKLPGHGINEPGFLQPPRPMSAIGG